MRACIVVALAAPGAIGAGLRVNPATDPQQVVSSGYATVPGDVHRATLPTQSNSFVELSEGEAGAEAAETPAQGGVAPNGFPIVAYPYGAMAPMSMYHGGYSPYNPQYNPQYNPAVPHPYAQMMNGGFNQMVPGMPFPPGAGQIPFPPGEGAAQNNTAGGNPAMYMTPMYPPTNTIPTTYPYGNAGGSAYHSNAMANGYPQGYQHGYEHGFQQNYAPQTASTDQYAHPMFHPGYVPTAQSAPVGSGMPHVPFPHPSTLPSVYDNFGYQPLNAKLAVPSVLPPVVGDATQQHAAMYGQETSGFSLTNTLNNVISSNNHRLTPVRLPNGMQMNVPSDELASMPNALPVLDLPSAPLLRNGDAAADQWRQRLDQAQANIAAQQAQFTSYSDAASQSMMGKEQESEVLQVRLQQLTKSLADAKHAAEMQKEWLDQVARRNAALEVDKHKVNAEAQLAGITMEYQKVRAQDEKLRQDMLKVAAAKEGLMKQAYAFRSVVRSDTQAIKKLMDGGKTSSADAAASPVPVVGADDATADKKAESAERAVIDSARAAAKKVEEADIEDSKASEVALKHMQSPAFEVPSGAGAGGAGGEASGDVAAASGPAAM